MKHILLILASFILLSFCCGCKSRRFAEKSDTKDSVRVETRYIETEKTDTCYIELPSQSAERVTRDTFSFLFNDYATSVAFVDKEGNLHHDLKTKDVQVPVEVKIKEIVKDSIVYRDRDKKEKEIVYVNELTGFQQWQIWSFWILLAIVVAYILYRVFIRKK